VTQIVVPRQSEEESEVDEEREQWLRNPVTVAIKVSFRRMLSDQQSQLFATCNKTSDPEVRGAYARYLELGRMVGMLDKGPK
jgi:hypothetical protein